MADPSTALAVPTGADDPITGAPDEATDRTEKVIALSRLALSVFALCVVILDPRQPMYSSGALYFLLGAYILYSAAVLVFVGSGAAL